MNGVEIQKAIAPTRQFLILAGVFSRSSQRFLLRHLCAQTHGLRHLVNIFHGIKHDYKSCICFWECSIKKQLLHLEKVSIIFTSRSTSLGSVQCERPYAERQAVRDTRNTANRHKHELMLV